MSVVDKSDPVMVEYLKTLENLDERTRQRFLIGVFSDDDAAPGTPAVKPLAQAIHALINSKPYSPRVEELEEVIGKHVPAVPSEEVTRVEPGIFEVAVTLLVYPLASKRQLRPSRFLASPPLHVAPNGIVLHTGSLLLIDPRCDDRTAGGNLVRPPMLCAVWYDQEHDTINGRVIDPWGAVKALAPQSYDRLIGVWHSIKQATP